MTGNVERKNLFVLRDTFPDAAALFSSQPKTLGSIKDTCLVVLDTSAMLVPYGVAPETMREVETAFGTLARTGRVRIPGQVAREFASNRPTKLMELYQQINTKKSQSEKIKAGRYPLLSGVGEYQEVVRLEAELNAKVAEYHDALSALSSHIKQWEWNDPLSNLYRTVFLPETVVELSMSEDELWSDYMRRQDYKIPPGYKDASKATNSAGDLIIWQTILQIGRDTPQDLLFVTTDQKSDWWYHSVGVNLYPRYELLDEYRRASGGKSLHLATLSTLLGLIGASSNAVEDIRQEEEIESGEVTIQRITEDWPRILALVHLANRRAEALLREAHPLVLIGGELVLETQYDFHAQKLRLPEVREIIQNVLRTLYGVPMTLQVAGPRSSTTEFDDVPF